MVPITLMLLVFYDHTYMVTHKKKPATRLYSSYCYAILLYIVIDMICFQINIVIYTFTCCCYARVSGFQINIIIYTCTCCCCARVSGFFRVFFVCFFLGIFIKISSSGIYSNNMLYQIPKPFTNSPWWMLHWNDQFDCSCALFTRRFNWVLRKTDTNMSKCICPRSFLHLSNLHNYSL